jgi:NAD(P)-dependent dehydrogenase (short-subunit alcohol dehydrogenase family)
MLSRPLALVTGASSGMGYEIAWAFAAHGFDLVVADEDARVVGAATSLRTTGRHVDAVEADLGTRAGVDGVLAVVGDRPLSAFAANARRTLGGAFFESDFSNVQRVVDTNVTGSLYLIHRIGWVMRGLGRGRILVTAAAPDPSPGRPGRAALDEGAKSMMATFALALREELRGSGVTLTRLFVGPTSASHAPDVARSAFDAMMAGEPEIVDGLVSDRASREVLGERSSADHFAPTRPGRAGRAGLRL